MLDGAPGEFANSSCSGHSSAEMLPVVYDELRRLARFRMAQEPSGLTLQATALVHEAFLRLTSRDDGISWESRGHFFAAAAEAMRRILVERARHKQTLKRGGGWSRTPLDRALRGQCRSPGGSARARRKPRTPRRTAPREGRTRQTPLFHRTDDQRGGRRTRNLREYGEQLLGVRTQLAAH